MINEYDYVQPLGSFIALLAAAPFLRIDRFLFER